MTTRWHVNCPLGLCGVRNGRLPQSYSVQKEEFVTRKKHKRWNALQAVALNTVLHLMRAGKNRKESHTKNV